MIYPFRYEMQEIKTNHHNIVIDKLKFWFFVGTDAELSKQGICF